MPPTTAGTPSLCRDPSVGSDPLPWHTSHWMLNPTTPEGVSVPIDEPLPSS